MICETSADGHTWIWKGNGRGLESGWLRLSARHQAAISVISENEHQEQTETVPKVSPRPTIFSLIIIILKKDKEKSHERVQKKRTALQRSKSKNCLSFLRDPAEHSLMLKVLEKMLPWAVRRACSSSQERQLSSQQPPHRYLPLQLQETQHPLLASEGHHTNRLTQNHITNNEK